MFSQRRSAKVRVFLHYKMNLFIAHFLSQNSEFVISDIRAIFVSTFISGISQTPILNTAVNNSFNVNSNIYQIVNQQLNGQKKIKTAFCIISTLIFRSHCIEMSKLHTCTECLNPHGARFQTFSCFKKFFLHLTRSTTFFYYFIRTSV